MDIFFKQNGDALRHKEVLWKMTMFVAIYEITFVGAVKANSLKSKRLCCFLLEQYNENLFSC